MSNRSEVIINRVLTEAKYCIYTKCTVRQIAKVFGVSKSTVHKDLTERLEKLNHLYYPLVRDVLQYNKSERAMRGGLATKKKYEDLRS